MKADEIQPGRTYSRRDAPGSFRFVEFVFPADPAHGRTRPWLCWNTAGFDYSDRSRGYHRNGVCYVDTFARWAHGEQEECDEETAS